MFIYLKKFIKKSRKHVKNVISLYYNTFLKLGNYPGNRFLKEKQDGHVERTFVKNRSHPLWNPFAFRGWIYIFSSKGQGGIPSLLFEYPDAGPGRFTHYGRLGG